MKTLLTLAVAALALAGCTGSPFTARPVAVPTVVSIPVENVTKTTKTDAASGATSIVFVTNTVSQLVTNWSTNTVFEVSETIARPLAAVTQLNAAVSQVAPNPVSGVLNLALGGLAALLGWMARVKTKSAAAANASADQKNALLKTVILGVEEANVPAVKEAITKIAKQWGTATELHAAVKEST